MTSVCTQRGLGLLMWRASLVGLALIVWLLARQGTFPPAKLLAGVPTRTYLARGTVQSLKPDGLTVVVRHEEIPGYMSAMTMPFKARAPRELAGLQTQDQISFRLNVTETESWINQVKRTGKAVPREPGPTAAPLAPSPGTHPLMQFKFTNELGQAVSLDQFHGQALAITFFFTRCPIPEYCPRLSQNFREATRKLLAMTNAPSNWHFLSVSFDPDFDSPAILKAYGERYQYDAAHWSFLTGPKERVRELASLSDVQFEREGGFFNHNFRTLVIDAAGKLQMSFPVAGDLSEALVEEVVKAAGVQPKAP